jgi:hypothetical protein
MNGINTTRLIMTMITHHLKLFKATSSIQYRERWKHWWDLSHKISRGPPYEDIVSFVPCNVLFYSSVSFSMSSLFTLFYSTGFQQGVGILTQEGVQVYLCTPDSPSLFQLRVTVTGVEIHWEAGENWIDWTAGSWFWCTLAAWYGYQSSTQVCTRNM